MANGTDDRAGSEAGGSVLPPRERWFVTLIVVGATIMVVLDTTIANVAIPHMQASLGATSESVAWVLTSYIVASAIAIPITGWLADRIGRRLLFTLSIVGFTLSSVLCGIAPSLGMMVGSRVLQGIFGAFIVPLSQALMYDINPREKHAQAMTIWGMAIMIAPVMGPVVGGWLTESYGWRWVFYINVPIGIVTAIASWLLLPERFGPRRRFDIVGFALLAVALAAFQLCLDRGTQLDWFQSPEIIAEAAITIAALWMLAVHLAGRSDAILPGGLFADRNFLTALIFITFLGILMFAGAALVAPLLQRLLGYPVLDAGLAIMPRGLGTLLGFVAAGKLIERVDARGLVAVGMLFIAWSLHIMTGFSLDMGSGPVMWSGLIQGIGMGLVMMPMNLLAFTTLSPALRTDGASLYNLLRNVGGSVGIATTSALFAVNVQVNHAEVGERLSLPALRAGLAERMGFDSARLVAFADAEVNRQAAMIAYIDDFWLMMWLTIACTPLVLLMRRPEFGAGVPVHIGE